MADARSTYIDYIEQNKRSSIVLVFFMSIFVVLLGMVFGQAYGDWRIGLAAALLISFVMLLFSWFSGDSAILGLSGAREIAKEDNPQLFNVVEELSIAAGTPMPKVYIIDEDSPNAFATGRDPEHASVAITKGLLEKLNRDELQGVMAHEMSHVRNYDIRFMMLMAVMVGVVVLMSDAVRRLAFYGGFGGKRRSSGSSSNSGVFQVVLVVVAIVMAIIAPVFATIIKLAVSRQREYLADASAVELTRNPEGLASALEKLSNDTEPLHAASKATDHLFIVSPLKGLKLGSDSIFSTHPPIAERVARLRNLQ